MVLLKKKNRLFSIKPITYMLGAKVSKREDKEVTARQKEYSILEYIGHIYS